MSGNSVQLFTGLISICTAFVGAYTIVLIFWFRRNTLLFQQEKEEKDKRRVAHQRTPNGITGSNLSSYVVQSTVGLYQQQQNVHVSKKSANAKWRRFRVAHNLLINVEATRRTAADEPASPTVPHGMSRRASFRSVSSEHSPHSPYVLRNGFESPTNSSLHPSLPAMDISPLGTLRPSTLSHMLTDAVRSSFASPGYNNVKKSKRFQQRARVDSIGSKSKDGDVLVSQTIDGKKKMTTTGRKFVPPSRGSRPAGALGDALPSNGFLRGSSLGTNVLETMSMRAPRLIKATTTSLEILWEPWIVGNESILKNFEISWRVMPGQQGVHSLDGWSSSSTRIHSNHDESDTPPRDQIHFEASSDGFSPIPRVEIAPDRQQRLIVQGLPSNCPLVEFRVRAMVALTSTPSLFKHRRSGNNDGTSTLWGPYSVAGIPMQTLDAIADPPMTGAITAGAIELRWGPPRDPRYGRTEGFTLTGKKAGSDTFVTIKSGARVHSSSIRSVNSIPLTPNTTYVFKLMVRTTAGELVSNPLPVTTLPAPPEAPMPPVVIRTTARHIELRWEAPHDHGSPITRYVLYGRRHRTSRFKRLFTGLSNSFVCGAREDGDQLAPDTLYVFKIKAVNGYGDSPASSIVTARTTQMSMAEAMNVAAGGNQNVQSSSSSPTNASSSSSSGETKTQDGNSPTNRNSSMRGNNNQSPPPGSPTNVPPGSPMGSSSPDIQRTGAGQKLASAPARVSELPNGWVECWDPGREICYYFNSLTGITQWIHPIHGKGGKDPDLNFRKKRFKLLYSIRERDWPQGGRKILKMTLRRTHLVVDSFEAIRRLDVAKLKLKTKVIFSGEEGIDSGGLTKEWFLELSRSLLDPQRCLLAKLEEAKGTIKYHIDHRSSINDQHLQYFHFLGIILAKAIYDRQLIDLPVCKAIYKYILGRPATLDDLEEMDPLYHRSIVWMLKNDIDDIIYETFTTTVENFGQMEEVELIPGGKEIPVTNANKARYVQAILDWKTFGSVARQLKSVREGFQEVLPIYEIRDFTEHELDLLLNGKQNFDVNEMRQATRYTGGYDANSSPIKIFWKVLGEFDREKRGQLLQFSTGSSKVPLDGYDPCFTITMATSEAGTQALPTSHTCFNQLVLPAYANEEEMLKKLDYALENAGGFHMS